MANKANSIFQNVHHSGSELAAALWERGVDEASDMVALAQEVIGLDRNFAPAYLKLAEALVRTGSIEDSYLCLSEALRTGRIEQEDETIRQLSLIRSEIDSSDSLINEYERMIGNVEVPKSRRPLEILVVTNLFPPQELGGYGRTMWEFCHGFRARGHRVHVITADYPELQRTSNTEEQMELEPIVERSLKLTGRWEQGAAIVDLSVQAIRQIYTYNARLVGQRVRRLRPDVCMVGNLDFLGWYLQDLLLSLEIPVVHRLGNAEPGYPSHAAPTSKLFCMAGNTQWMNRTLKSKGYHFPRSEIVYPGSPLEYYYRAFAPNLDMLRIAYASIVREFKGVDVLVNALVELKEMGVSFYCEIAGEQVKPSLVADLKLQLEQADLGGSVRFIGFQSKQGLADLFARSNVLVFPSRFEEPFGKTQIEAMAAGLIVVSSGTGGSTEIVKHGENGLIFESGNPKDLAETLKYLNENKDVWRDLAAKGQASAFNFTTEKSVSKLESIFESLSHARK